MELEDYLPDDAAKGAFEYTNLASVARYYNMDMMVESFIEKHNPCNVIYFGAELESAYFRITEKTALGKAKFYEIDLPEVMDARRKVFGENQDEKLIAGDMFSMDWLAKIEDKTLPTIMLVSGVFQYFMDGDIPGIRMILKTGFILKPMSASTQRFLEREDFLNLALCVAMQM